MPTLCGGKMCVAENLDDLDQSILRILQKDCRLPFSKIAQLTGSPESTVRFRTQRLVERKVITKFTIHVDPRKVGMPVVLILMLKINFEQRVDTFNIIAEMSEVLHAFQCTGNYDLIAILHARDLEHVNSLTNKVKATKGVAHMESLIATGLVKVDTDLYF